MGNLDCLITCVGYDDFLRRTVPINRHQFRRLLVITSPEDNRTISYCQEQGIETVITDSWTVNGATFNKGRALNDGLAELRKADPDWVCVLDADIILRPGFNLTPHLNPENLYSAKRRLCLHKYHYEQWLAQNNWDWDNFTVEEIPIESPNGGGDKRLWGNRRITTDNPAGALGYLQLWSMRQYKAQYPTNFQNAHSYDIRFAMGWPDNKRFWLPTDVLHLGWRKLNWAGRVTKRWD